MSLERTIVQCRRGAYDETVWLPLASFNAVRLGSRRFPQCPVHERWELTRMVPEEEWTLEVIAEAEAHRDSDIV